MVASLIAAIHLQQK